MHELGVLDILLTIEHRRESWQQHEQAQRQGNTKIAWALALSKAKYFQLIVTVHSTLLSRGKSTIFFRATNVIRVTVRPLILNEQVPFPWHIYTIIYFKDIEIGSYRKRVPFISSFPVIFIIIRTENFITPSIKDTE